MDKVFAVVYNEVFGEYVREGMLVDVSGSEDCLIKLKNGRIVSVPVWCVFDTAREAQECLLELIHLEQDARDDAAQVYYEDFLECVAPADIALIRNAGCPF